MLGLKLNHISKRGHRRLRVRYNLYGIIESAAGESCKNLIKRENAVWFFYRWIGALVGTNRSLPERHWDVKTNNYLWSSVHILHNVSLAENNYQLHGGGWTYNLYKDESYKASNLFQMNADDAVSHLYRNDRNMTHCCHTNIQHHFKTCLYFWQTAETFRWPWIVAARVIQTGYWNKLE